MLTAVDSREEKRNVKISGYGRPQKPAGFRAWLMKTGRRAAILIEELWSGEKAELLVQVNKK